MEKTSPLNEQPTLVEGNDLRGSPEEEYILKWTDHKVNFFSLAAADLFNEEDLTDVTICCGEKLFDAHKLILSACSPYFKSMLTHKKKLNKVTMSSSVASPNEASSPTSGCCHSHLSQMHPIIFLKDVPPSDFERLLQFMYHGEVRVPNEDLESLILTAKSLKVKGLSASALPSSLTQPLTSQSIPETHEECGEDLSTKSRKPIGTIKHKEKITNKHHNNHTPPKKRRISASSLHALSVNNHHDFDKEQVDENIEHPTPPTLTTTSAPNHHSNNHPFSGHPESQSHRSILSNTAERFSHHREHHHKLRSSISAALISEMASDRILNRRMSPTRSNTSPSPSSPSTRPMTANSFISSIRRQPLTPPPTNCGNIIGRGNNALERRERLAPIRHSSGHQLCSTTTPRTNSSKNTSNSKQISLSTDPAQDPILTPLVQLKEEAVSPPPSSNEMVTLVNDQQLLAAGRHPSSVVGSTGSGPARLSLAATRALTESTRILPPSEPRQNGTCYFCKKAFMKNKQLMNHVCPKKPKPK